MAPTFLESISDSDLKRFACCYLASERSNVDWDKAFALYGGAGKLESFKTVTGKATKKVVAAIDSNGNIEGGDDASKSKKTSAKRKKAADEDGEVEAPKKKKGGKKAKKSVTPEQAEEDDEEKSDSVKDEQDDDII